MLVHRRIKELAKFVSKDVEKESLKKIHVGRTEAAATDGHVLVMMPIDGVVSDDDYPATPNTTDITEPVLVDVDTLEKAIGCLPKKSSLPILNNIQLGTVEGKLVINVGLPPAQFHCEDTTGLQYPNYAQVTPDYSTQQPIRFALNAEILKRVCELAIRCGNKYTKQITFEIPTVVDKIVLDTDGNKTQETAHVTKTETAIKFDIRDDGATVFRGLIMPLRIE